MFVLVFFLALSGLDLILESNDRFLSSFLTRFSFLLFLGHVKHGRQTGLAFANTEIAWFLFLIICPLFRLLTFLS